MIKWTTAKTSCAQTTTTLTTYLPEMPLLDPLTSVNQALKKIKIIPDVTLTFRSALPLPTLILHSGNTGRSFLQNNNVILCDLG